MYKAIIFVAISIMLIACSDDTSSTYKYEVTGTAGRYSVSILDEFDQTKLKGIVGNNWTYSWNQIGKRYIFIIAQNYEKQGTVTVSIYKNGKQIATDTKNGADAIASISGKY
jgi:hypothetical protein